MWRALAVGLVAVAALGLVGCQNGSGPPPAGSIEDASITAPDGRVRSYRVYVPSTLDADQPAPLLVALHGGAGSGPQFEENSGFDQIAEAAGFIVVYPNGTQIGIIQGGVWNGGKCCGRAQDDRDNVDDVGFIRVLVDKLKTEHSIDDRRVFATGHSNGAIMSYRLACELSDRIAAVGFQAGSLELDVCEPAQPVSVLHIHGAADLNIPIDGGEGQGLSNTNFTSPIASVERFAALDGCAAVVESVDSTNGDVGYRTWQPCAAGSGVQMAVVQGANHAWMGHAGSVVQNWIVGTPYMGYDSSLAIWNFLSAHGR